MKKVIDKAFLDYEYLSLVSNIITNLEVSKLKEYAHHGEITRFEHVVNVSYMGYKIAKRFNWDYMSIARAGLLHDLFFYNWREEKKKIFSIKENHALIHGNIALQNSEKIFKLSKKEKEMIKKHMWPITIIPPRYAMTYFIGIIDKFSAILEFYQNFKMAHEIKIIKSEALE